MRDLEGVGVADDGRGEGKDARRSGGAVRQFHDLVTGKLAEPEQKALGSLRAFAGVSSFPLRVKCASLAWHAMHSALDRRGRADHDGRRGARSAGDRRRMSEI